MFSMEAGTLGNYSLSEHLLGLFCIIHVRNYISWFSVFLFLTMAMPPLLGLSTWLQIFFFLRYKCKRSNITLFLECKKIDTFQQLPLQKHDS